MICLMFSGTTETALTTFTGSEFLYYIEAGLYHRHDDKLGDAFEWIENEGFLAAIPAGDQQLALVIRIDEADEIAEYDAVLMA